MEIAHEHVEANGLRFAVSRCGEGDRLALCLHGFPECRYSWRHQLPLLARLGYRAWAPDLRGYGGTERPVGRQHYALEKLMDDVSGLIDASGAREVVLLAHDWGAIIAWFYAMRRARPLDGLVIMNVPHPTAAREAAGLRQRLRSWYMLLFQLPWLPERLLLARPVGRLFHDTAVNQERFGPEVQAVYTANARIPGAAKAMIDYYRGLVIGGGWKRQSMLGTPRIDVRTLMLWGEQDVALGKETTVGTERFVADLTLRYLPDASHWVQQDDPETVNAMLEAWLQHKPVPEASQLP